MSRYPGASRFVRRAGKESTNLKNSNKSASKAQAVIRAQQTAIAAKEAVDAADLPVDDGNPPAAPTNVYAGKDDATGMASITYDPASPSTPQYVRSAQVRYRKVGAVPWVTKEADPRIGLLGVPLTGVGITGPADNFEAQAEFTDAFGRVSGWAPVTPAVSLPETYVPYLRAERLVAGSIAVLLDMVVGGKIQAGRTRLSELGLEVGVLTDSVFFDFNNDINLDSRISSSNLIAGNRGTLTFYADPGWERSIELVQSTSVAEEISSVLVGAMKSDSDITGVQNAYIYITRSPPSEGSIGYISVHGETYFDNVVMFERPPHSYVAATGADDLTRRADVDARIDALATALTLVTPSITAGWSEVAGNPLQVRRTANGWLSVSGKIRNTSGGSKNAGSNIWTNVVANRPSTPRTFPCARTDGSQTWVVDASVPVGVNANGDVLNRVNVGSGVEFDLSTIGYQVGV